MISLIKKIIKKTRKAFDNNYYLEDSIKNQLVIQKYESLSFNSSASGIDDNLRFENKLIVSLTTYGFRINDVYLTIESILNQTVKPNKVILWLDHSFKNKRLPIVLQKQMERGLEIQFCEDVRSYTKLIPTLEKYPDSIIITIDDDMIYTHDFIEYLVNSYLNNPNKIYFYRGHKIVFDKNKNLMPYKNWVKEGAQGSSLLNVPTGVCGVLYPPNCFHEDITNRELFMKLCPHADDIWFKAMSYLKNIECEKIETGKAANDKFVYVNTAIETSLSNINNVQGMNDVQIKQVFDFYKINFD